MMSACPYCEHRVLIAFGLLFTEIPNDLPELHVCAGYDGRLEVRTTRNEVFDRLAGDRSPVRLPSRPVGVVGRPSDPHHHHPPRAA